MNVKDRLFELQSLSFEGDDGFIEDRLPSIISIAESSLLSRAGSDLYIEYKKEKPLLSNNVESDTLGTKINVSNSFSKDDIVFVYGDVNYNTTAVVLEATDTYIVIDTDYTAVSSLNIITRKKNDILNALCYIVYSEMLDLLQQISRDAGSVARASFNGEVVDTSIRKNVISRKKRYLTKAEELISEHLATDDKTLSYTIIEKTEET